MRYGSVISYVIITFFNSRCISALFLLVRAIPEETDLLHILNNGEVMKRRLYLNSLTDNAS